MQKIIKILRNPKIFSVTIIWLMILVVLGTLAQRDMGLFAAQQRYFSSYIIWLFGFVPAPGGRITMMVILINIITMLIANKNIWKIKKIGILIVHIGALLLLIGGGITAKFSSEGQMIIEEGTSANYIIDYRDMELALINRSSPHYDEYTIIDQHALYSRNIISPENMNIDIQIIQLIENCRPQERTGATGLPYKGILKNFTFNELEPAKEDNENLSALIFNIRNSGTSTDGTYGLILNQPVPQNIKINEQVFEMKLRRKRTYLPFSLELIDFKKVDHPGTRIAKSYSSDINLIENNLPRRVSIQMNEPLRHNGYTFFQSSFIEGSDIDTTVLAVVKNYGRLFPYISSIIMSIGLLLHLLINLPKLFKKNIAVRVQ